MTVRCAVSPLASAIGIIALTLIPDGRALQPPPGWELVVLGIAQDAGIPQLGCQQALCVSIRSGKRKPERVASIGVVHAARGRAFLFDATPDFVSQVHSLTGGRPPDGIFLTHAHAGHYTGLMYLGRESIDAKGVPVYGTARMASYLRANGPWSLLVSRGNIDVRPVTEDRAVDLGDGLRVTPLLVPHRDEFTDTVGYVIEDPRGRRCSSRTSTSGRSGHAASAIWPIVWTSHCSMARSRQPTRSRADRSPRSRTR